VRALVASLVVLLLVASSADARQFTVRLEPRSTTVFESQVLRRDVGLDITARANGRPLRQGLTDGALTFALRGHGVTVTLQAKRGRGRARIEVANFLRRPVRVLVRVRMVRLVETLPETVTAEPVLDAPLCVSPDQVDCVDPADGA
jgi:hypothetical protein